MRKDGGDIRAVKAWWLGSSDAYVAGEEGTLEIVRLEREGKRVKVIVLLGQLHTQRACSSMTCCSISAR